MARIGASSVRIGNQECVHSSESQIGTKNRIQYSTVRIQTQRVNDKNAHTSIGSNDISKTIEMGPDNARNADPNESSPMSYFLRGPSCYGLISDSDNDCTR